MDRRIKKTKAAIKQYVIDTYSANGSKRLVISQLCEAIDINRSTFYLHYPSIDAVIKEIEDDALTIISSIANEYEYEYLSLIDGICSYIKNNVKLFKALFNVASEHFTNLIFKRFYDLVGESILVKQLTNPQEKDYVITFIIFGCVGAFKKWINENFKTSELDIIKAFLKFLRLDVMLDNN